ncbi:hypothetical protein [Streptomyces buecherae]|uniref:hypothetical protein n=1 Tax=Streptomyces buecherae TaxID=2763006 RepID=UPI0037A0AC96
MVMTRLSKGMHVTGALVSVACLLLAGCGNETTDVRPLPEADGKAESPTPVPKQPAALEAYRAMWRDLARASETSDVNAPSLDDHASDGALELLKHGLRKAKEEGVVSKGEPVVNPRTVSTSSHEVVVQDCVDGTDWLQYQLNGELKNDVPGGHKKADATVRHDGRMWKVTDLYLHASGSC